MIPETSTLDKQYSHDGALLEKVEGQKDKSKNHLHRRKYEDEFAVACCVLLAGERRLHR